MPFVSASPEVKSSVAPYADGHRKAITRVVEAMRSNLDEPHTLARMARIALLSPFYFHRLFRQLTGIPPMRFLYALRQEAARNLLMQPQSHVVDVSYAVGFKSPGTFTRRFTELMGIPPSRLRNLLDAPLAPAEIIPDPTISSVASGTVAGMVSVPAGFSRGLILVGLFRQPIPQRAPVACAVLHQAGAFRTTPAPDGDYYLFAMGISSAQRLSDCLENRAALRAGGNAITIRDGVVTGSTVLPLRLPSPLDPPILVAVSSLLKLVACGSREESVVGEKSGYAGADKVRCKSA